MMLNDAKLDEMWDAIHDGDCKKIDALVRRLGVDTRVEGDDWNFLHMALDTITIPPNPDVIRHLIALGVDVNARDIDMWTPLHFAARTQNSRVVKLLIDAGAEIDAVDNEGITPLHQCLLERPCNLEVAEMLLAAGADGGGAVRKFVNAVSAPDIPAIRALLEKYAKKKKK